jgi:hypothetical protein
VNRVAVVALAGLGNQLCKHIGVARGFSKGFKVDGKSRRDDWKVGEKSL